MPSNTELNAGSGGDVITTKQRTHDGDTTLQQVVSVAGVTGTEDSYTHTDIQAGGGAEANALRVTLANDSTGLVSVDDNGGSLTVDNAGLTELAAAINASSQMDVNIAAQAADVTIADGGNSITVDGTVTANLGATDNAVLDQIEVNTSYGDNTGGGTETGALRVTIANNSTGVLSVDDNGGSLTVDGTTRTEYSEDAATPATIVGTAVMAERDDALSTITPAEGDWAGLRVDANGALWTNVSNAEGTSTDDAAFTPGTDTVAVMGGFADEASTDSVDEGDVGALRMSLDRKLYTIPSVHTSGGTTLYKNIDVDESEDAVKASAGQIYWINAINLSSSPLYLKFYNATVATVVVGTTTPDMTFPLPTQGDTNGAGFTLSIPNGIAFDTAITIACTTGVADNDSGAPGANACVVNLGYA